MRFFWILVGVLLAVVIGCSTFIFVFATWMFFEYLVALMTILTVFILPMLVVFFLIYLFFEKFAR